MTKFHVTDDGPKPCKATKRECPIGGEHFSKREDAQKTYESQQETIIAHTRDTLRKSTQSGGKQLDRKKTYMMIDTETGTVFSENAIVIDLATLKDPEAFQEHPDDYGEDIPNAHYIKDTESIEHMESPIIYEPDTELIVSARSIRAVDQEAANLDEEELDVLLSSDRAANEYGNEHGVLVF